MVLTEELNNENLFYKLVGIVRHFDFMLS